MAVEQWVKDIVHDTMGGAPFAVGDVVNHPEDGLVRIVGGQFWGTHGVSNFWTWIPVDAEGNEEGPKRSGYGWRQ